MRQPDIPITRLDLGDEEAEAVSRVVRSGWVMQGPEVEAFEAELASAVGAPHAVAVANGTLALELTLRALGVGPGHEVVTVSHSFVATANSVLAVGARPVLVDVEEDTLGLDPQRLEAALSPATRAVLCVHQLGIPCDVEAILEVTRRHGLPLVEDAACALGSETTLGGERRRVGEPFGAAACFSFHPRKLVTTGEGGAITTADAGLERRLRLLRQHGLLGGEQRHVVPAFNARMSDLHAALGRPQLRRLGAILGRRRELAAALSAALADHPVLAPPRPRPGALWNWQSYPARLRPGAPAPSQVLAFLHAHGVGAKGGLTNAHQEPAYADAALWRRGPGGLGVSERLRETTVLLPLFQALTAAELQRLLSVLGKLAEVVRR